MEPRVMPSTIDYSSMLPMSVPAMASRRKFFPSNGSTFSNLGNRQIRIELAHGSALLDPSHSYLQIVFILLFSPQYSRRAKVLLPLVLQN